MSTSTAYHLVGQSSSDPDPDLDHDEVEQDPTAAKIGKRLGAFRAVYLVALCCIGSFLFAYVRSATLQARLIANLTRTPELWAAS